MKQPGGFEDKALAATKENVAKAWKVSWYYSLNQFTVYVFEYMMVSGFAERINHPFEMHKPGNPANGITTTGGSGGTPGRPRKSSFLHREFFTLSWMLYNAGV